MTNPVTIGDCTLYFGDCPASDVWPLIRDFHYSRRLPGNVQACFVLRREGGLFGQHGDIVAACLFSLPPTRWGEPVLELTRLVRDENTKVQLTGLISKSIRALKNRGYDLVVSFADSTHDHHGGIYQAASWKYSGKNNRQMDGLIVNGVFVPGRSCNSKWGTRSPTRLQERFPQWSIEPHFDKGKHLYFKTLSKSGQKKAKRLNLHELPYPKPSRDQSTRRADPIGESQENPLVVAPAFPR